MKPGPGKSQRKNGGHHGSRLVQNAVITSVSYCWRSVSEVRLWNSDLNGYDPHFYDPHFSEEKANWWCPHFLNFIVSQLRGAVHSPAPVFSPGSPDRPPSSPL